ncbi:retrovirus-related pol polyprotein from transposon TNT 1-94 [Tanacetum coccineum]
MVGGNGLNQFRQYAWQNGGDQIVYNAVQNAGNQIVYNAVQNTGNQNGNGNVVTTRAEGNGNGNNANQIRCYNCKGVGHYARNYTIRPRRKDVAYLETQLLIAQKEEARIQLQAEEFDLMAAAADCEEIEEVKVNCILMANLQQASTSSTHTDKAPVYDSDGSIEERYTELLESTTDTHLVQQDDSNVILLDSSMNPSGGDVEQHPGTIEETHAFFESLYNNLAIEVENVNTVNRETKEANVKLIAELARYRGR